MVTFSGTQKKGMIWVENQGGHELQSISLS